MVIHLIIFNLFVSLLGQPCNEFCAVCKDDETYIWINPNEPPDSFEFKFCTKCIDGYYMDDSWYNIFYPRGCLKQCIQSCNENECKICHESEKGECFQCWDNYLLSEDKKKCEPNFVICDGEKIMDCLKCEDQQSNTNNTRKCAQCRRSFNNVDGYCEYDVTGGDGRNYISEFIVKNILLTIVLIFL